jgi:hypothetical protein
MEPMSEPKKKSWQIKLAKKKSCAKSKLGEA